MCVCVRECVCMFEGGNAGPSTSVYLLAESVCVDPLDFMLVLKLGVKYVRLHWKSDVTIDKYPEYFCSSSFLLVAIFQLISSSLATAIYLLLFITAYSTLSPIHPLQLSLPLHHYISRLITSSYTAIYLHLSITTYSLT